MTVLGANNELYHHGIKNQKWGVRRYQNEDGSLTPEGRKRYAKQKQKELKDLDTKIRVATVGRNQSDYEANRLLRKMSYNDKIGKSDKNKKLQTQMEAHAHNAGIYDKNRNDAMTKFAKTLADVEKQGYTWTNKSSGSIYPIGINEAIKARNLIDDYSKLNTKDIPSMYLIGTDNPNATRYNNIKIKDLTSISEKTKAKYEANQTIYPYIPGNYVRR